MKMDLDKLHKFVQDDAFEKHAQKNDDYTYISTLDRSMIAEETSKMFDYYCANPIEARKYIRKKEKEKKGLEDST